MRRVDFRHAMEMSDGLAKAAHDGSTEEAIRRCEEKAKSFLQDLGFSVAKSDAELNSCALTAQFFCVAFLSYIQAHAGPLDPFFLDTPQRKLSLLGTERTPGGASIVAELFELTCLSGVTQQSVLGFSTGELSGGIASGNCASET